MSDVKWMLLHWSEIQAGRLVESDESGETRLVANTPMGTVLVQYRLSDMATARGKGPHALCELAHRGREAGRDVYFVRFWR
jgi:hypothetical protein